MPWVELSWDLAGSEMLPESLRERAVERRIADRKRRSQTKRNRHADSD